MRGWKVASQETREAAAVGEASGVDAGCVDAECVLERIQ